MLIGSCLFINNYAILHRNYDSNIWTLCSVLSMTLFKDKQQIKYYYLLPLMYIIMTTAPHEFPTAYPFEQGRQISPYTLIFSEKDQINYRKKTNSNVAYQRYSPSFPYPTSSTPFPPASTSEGKTINILSTSTSSKYKYQFK